MTPRGVRSLSLQQCRELLETADTAALPALLRSLAGDRRAGVREAVAVARNRLRAREAEAARLEGLAALEEELRRGGYAVVAGIDEVGRGALAGPLTAGAVVLPAGLRIEGLDDSKRLTPECREHIAAAVRERCHACAVAHVDPGEIDAKGMSWAVREAMRRALDSIGCPVDHVVVDGLGVGLGIPETAVVGGDAKVAAIAAASVVAKVTRDALMVAHAADHREYLFEENKGYGTPEHLAAIAVHGLCPLHRRSFHPCEGTPPLF
ncbi:MAG: ribonuclease HII [Coriobacteriia bacterium]|nr:ribonuclease HII [Coriobacteriia bacterium]